MPKFFNEIPVKVEQNNIISVDPNNTQIQKNYYKSDLILDQDHYCSPWSALLCFRDAVKVDEPKAKRLVECYLKGIFLGVLKPEVYNINNLQSNELKQALKDLYKTDVEADPFLLENLVLLKYKKDANEYIVAISSPHTAFFPTCYFSNWPEDIKEVEKEMVEEIEEKYSKLSQSYKNECNNFISYVVNTFQELRNLGWAGTPSALTLSSNLNIRLYKDPQTYVDLFQLNIITNLANLNIGVSSQGNKIEITEGSNKIFEFFGCQGRDGKYYIIEDDKNKYEGVINLGTIEIIFQKPKEAKRDEQLDIESISGEIIIKGAKDKNFPVNFINKDEIFCKKLAIIGGKKPDYPIKKNFIEDGNLGLKGIKFVNDALNINGDTLKIYNRSDFVDIKANLAFYPKFEGIENYFAFLETDEDFHFEFSSIKPNQIKEIKLNKGENKKKINKEYILSKGHITVLDKDFKEYGTFNLTLNSFKHNPNQNYELAIDLGTVLSCSACKDHNSNINLIDVGMDENLCFLLGQKFPAYLPKIKKEFPSFIKSPKPDLTEGFASMDFWAEDGIPPLNNKDYIGNLKWSGGSDYFKLFLYGYLHMLFFSTGNDRNLEKIYFSIPLSMSAGDFRAYAEAVDNAINQLKQDIGPNIFNPVPLYVKEIDPIIQSMPIAEEGNYLVVDLGGGSCDYALLKITQNNKDIKINDSIRIAGEYLRKIDKQKADYIYCFLSVLFRNISVNCQILKESNISQKKLDWDYIIDTNDIEKIYLFGNTWNYIQKEAHFPNIYREIQNFNILQSFSYNIFGKNELGKFEIAQEVKTSLCKNIFAIDLKNNAFDGNNFVDKILENSSQGKKAIFGFNINEYEWLDKINEKPFAFSKNIVIKLVDKQIKEFFSEFLKTNEATINDLINYFNVILKSGNSEAKYGVKLQEEKGKDIFLKSTLLEILSLEFIEKFLKL